MKALFKKYPIIRLTILFLLCILDMIATYLMVTGTGDLSLEGNPLMRMLIRAGWPYAVFVKMSLSAVAVIALGIIYKNNKKISGWGINIIIVGHFVVVTNHLIHGSFFGQ